MTTYCHISCINSPCTHLYLSNHIGINKCNLCFLSSHLSKLTKMEDKQMKRQSSRLVTVRLSHPNTLLSCRCSGETERRVTAAALPSASRRRCSHTNPERRWGHTGAKVDRQGHRSLTPHCPQNTTKDCALIKWWRVSTSMNVDMKARCRYGTVSYSSFLSALILSRICSSAGSPFSAALVSSPPSGRLLIFFSSCALPSCFLRYLFILFPPTFFSPLSCP